MEEKQAGCLVDDEHAGPALCVSKLMKRFGSTKALDNVSLSVPGGLLLSLLGPSGSGKTTLLRLIGGFETPDRGSIEIGGRDVTGIPAYRREIGVVFQGYSLFPHMSVAENVGFPLKQRGMRSPERATRISEILDTVGLASHADRRPADLSGGQQQRVALARALVYKPRLLVMDEPLAALDKGLRVQMQQEMLELQRRTGITMLYITHDQTEAFAMADLIAVMNAGKIEQVGPPRELYERPGTGFVARFVGDSNLFEGEPRNPVAGERAVILADGSLVRYRTVLDTSGPVTLLVRPEKIRISDEPGSAADENVLRGQLLDAKFLGEATSYRVVVSDRELVVRVQNCPGVGTIQRGSAVTLTWAVDDTIVV